MKSLILSLILAAVALPAAALEFDSIRFLPRQENLEAMHIPKRWTLETSRDGITWATLAEGNFENDRLEKIIPVPKTRTQHLRFSSLESHDGQMQTAVGEFGVQLMGKDYSSHGWKMTANNQVGITQNPWGPAAFAFDGDPQTCWHTQYLTGTTLPFPHTLTLDFGEEFRGQGTVVELEWDANPDPVDGYVVLYGSSPATMSQSHASDKTTASIGKLNPGDWFFTVRAKRGELLSEDSSIVAATILPPPPPAIAVPAPRNLRTLRIVIDATVTVTPTP